ncbi:MAG: rod shape-determining protein MreC [Bdellovibrionaceae bacterium]|nr:rod shape-determining protein MreC [Bdellovibrionales bacterium]MCB9082823.1 rod shape-determining protein MreC [Pseudobdellovibrionaceae bacterium]
MNFFSLDLRKILLVLAVVALPLLVANLQRDAADEVPWYARPFTFLTGIIQNTYSSFSSGVRGTTAMYLNLIDIKKHNRVLTQDNAELRAQLGALTELKMENQRLNELLAFRQKSKMDLLAAKVVGRDLLADHHSITINRGSNNGIAKNMAAITTGGVVGYVFRVEPFTSQILLLVDRYAVIDAIVQRSRARGIVEGRSPDGCRLRYLNRSDDVQMGDLVVTSGLDNIFPKGFPVGLVTSVAKSRYGMTQEVELKPAINASILEEVFIVTNAQHEDFTPKAEEQKSAGGTEATNKDAKPAAEEVKAN